MAEFGCEGLYTADETDAGERRGEEEGEKASTTGHAVLYRGWVGRGGHEADEGLVESLREGEVAVWEETRAVYEEEEGSA